MSLAARLDGIRAAGGKRIPEDKRVIIGAAYKELVDSGVMNGVIKVGDSLPPHMGRRRSRLHDRARTLVRRRRQAGISENCYVRT